MEKMNENEATFREGIERYISVTEEWKRVIRSGGVLVVWL